MDHKNQPPSPIAIIFFDGVCGLCNRFVDLLLRIDTDRRFFFAPLQGDTATKLLGGQLDLTNPTSIVLLIGDQRFERSEAVGIILRSLGWPWKAAGLTLALLPQKLADWGYDQVATNRYRLFGKLESCRLPTSEEQDRFLP